ncbi:amino acid adenylation domain-containing protein [Chitinophaga solisilvae]|uniref:non-ribosomal peptide synthetase family protein n=1 Tax=Chitinophaga solisilvae TaxID=1233460 RepID=UPI0013704B4D|nr:amino acid adenylation domain-containing protein [Chitinophaga solisilvae]
MNLTQDETIIDIFEKQVTLHAGKTALVHLSESITYQEFNNKANQLARYLIAAGVTRGALVAICLEQSISRPLSILALMKIGAAYIPLDPEYPEARINFMLEDTKASHAITTHELSSRFSNFEGKIIIPGDEQQLISANPTSNLEVPILLSDLVYVIYTSGSTGNPKGVAVQHSAVASFTKNYLPVTSLTAENTVIQILSYTFDASFMDQWIPLLVGATLHLYPDNKMLGAPLLAFIREHHIDTITMITPTILASIPQGEPFGELTSIGVGGEVCPENVYLYWAAHVKLYNAYGPTESTIAVTCHRYEQGQSVRNIGKALPGVEFYILDSNFRQLPAGETGELFIGGSQLAKEYLNRPALTAEKFPYINIADNPTDEKKIIRMYKTGDIVKLLPDGNIEFIGRNDSQIKVRGFRIEPGEIESHINSISGVKESAVVAINAQHGQAVLAAFITLQQFPADDELRVKAHIRKSLQRMLPSYMVPEKIAILEALPQTPAGKTDKKVLQTMSTEERLSLDGLDENDIESILITVWKHVLQWPEIKPTDNFFDLGGHSLGIVRVLASLPDNIRIRLKLIDLYLFPTIETLAAEIRARDNKPPQTFEEKMKLSTEILLNDILLEADYDYPTDIDPGVLAAPRKVFLTGPTGFVGVHLLLELLAGTAADVYCLVRAENTAHAIERIKFTLGKYNMPWPEDQQHRIKPVIGDFTLDNMGIPEDEYQRLSSEVEIIYHTGGNVNYIKPYPIMKAVNVDGIQKIIAFATTTKLKYLVACSTVAVFSWGYLLTGKTWMYEDEDIHQNLPTICRDTNYVRSKWVMEKILEKAKKKGLPVIGIRLGFVMCHGTTGATEMNQWWGSFVRCCLSLGVYPMIMGLKDQLITVDFVAKAIVHISKNKDAPGKYFHMVPSPVHDLSVSDFFVKLNECLNLNLVPAHFRDWLALWKDNENSPLYSLLSLFTEEVVPGKSLVEVYEMTYYFERRNTDEFLKGTDIKTPVINKELLTKYLDFMGVSLPT